MASFAEAEVAYNMEQEAARVDAPVAVVGTVSAVTGRRLPPKPAWWKGDEAATMHNRVAAESLAKASPSRRR